MVGIITDTTAALPLDVVQEYRIPIMPQVVNFGSSSFLEGVDLDLSGFMQLLGSSSQLPKTAAPPPELFVKALAEMVPREETILCIHPSGDVSGTVRSAMVAAAEFPDADIRVIDTRLVAGPLASLVTLAAQWARQGLDADAIESRVRALAGSGHCYFVVATLEFLAKGGRIGGLLLCWVAFSTLIRFSSFVMAE